MLLSVTKVHSSHFLLGAFHAQFHPPVRITDYYQDQGLLMCLLDQGVFSIRFQLYLIYCLGKKMTLPNRQQIAVHMT